MGSFSPDFLFGFAVATVLWLIISQIVRMYRSYMKRIKAAHSPQKDKAPAAVIADANRARLGLMLWFLVVLLLLLALWEFLTWGTGVSLIGRLTG